MFQKLLLSASLSLSLVLLTSADITWPLYSQQCQDDAGPPFLDDEETFGPGGKYHDGSAAYPQLLEDGSCAKPLQNACASRDDKKTAYLEGPIDCGDKGWYCRIYNDEENGWANINLAGDYNFGNCNSTSSFEDAGYDRDGHCHGSSVDNTYYWWIRDHWHRQYNGRVRCCCGWSEGGTQPLFSRRIANRCDYRRLVTETENLDDCRDANEGHNLGFDDTNPNLGVDDIACDKSYQSSQLNNPIPEDDDVCWEIQRFGFTEGGGSPPTQSPDAPSPVASPTTESPVASPSTKSPVSVPTTSSPVSSPVNDDEDDENPDEDEEEEEPEDEEPCEGEDCEEEEEEPEDEEPCEGEDCEEEEEEEPEDEEPCEGEDCEEEEEEEPEDEEPCEGEDCEEEEEEEPEDEEPCESEGEDCEEEEEEPEDEEPCEGEDCEEEEEEEPEDEEPCEGEDCEEEEEEPEDEEPCEGEDCEEEEEEEEPEDEERRRRLRGGGARK